MDERFPWHRPFEDILLGTASPIAGGTVYWKQGRLSFQEQRGVEAHEQTHLLLFYSTTLGIFQAALSAMLSADSLSAEHQRVLRAWLDATLDSSRRTHEGVASYAELSHLSVSDPSLALHRRSTFPPDYVAALEPVEQFADSLSLPFQARASIAYHTARAALQVPVLLDIRSFQDLLRTDPSTYLASPERNTDKRFAELLAGITQDGLPERLSELLEEPYSQAFLDAHGVDPRDRGAQPKEWPSRTKSIDIDDVVRAHFSPFLEHHLGLPPDVMSPQEMHAWYEALRRDLQAGGLDYMDAHGGLVLDDRADEAILQTMVVHHIADTPLTPKAVASSDFSRLVLARDGFLALVGEATDAVSEIGVANMLQSDPDTVFGVFHPARGRGSGFILDHDCYVASVPRRCLPDLLRAVEHRTTAVVVESTDFDFTTGQPFFGDLCQPLYVYLPPMRLLWDEERIDSLRRWTRRVAVLVLEKDAFYWLFCWGDTPGICCITTAAVSTGLSFIEAIAARDEPEKRGKEGIPGMHEPRTRLAVYRIARHGI